jgi:uncharacterized protein
MRRIAWVLGTGFMAWAALPVGKAEAASFNCARARAADEVAVCHNATLSSLDSEMGGLWYAFSRVPMLMGENGNRRGDEQAFLDRRRRCRSNITCLTATYRARIGQLHTGIDGAMAAYSHIVLGTDQ